MNTEFGDAERLDLIDSAILLNCRQHNSHLRARLATVTMVRDLPHGDACNLSRVSETDLIRDAHEAISDSLVELETHVETRAA